MVVTDMVIPSLPPAVRMDELATLPVFFRLRGKRVVLAGGDPPAVWKAELLTAAGAHVEVLAIDAVPQMHELAASPPDGSLTIIERPWSPSDLAGAALAIGAISLDSEAEAFRDAARAAGVPVNVVDKPAFCDFQFGTVVARSPLVIGISTDGAAPVLGQALRARIEAIVPRTFRRWAQAAKEWRPAVQARALDFRQRRRFWEAFTARALAAGDRLPSDADQAACFAAVEGQSGKNKGQLTLVGCIVDSPGSLTLDAVAALQSADVVGFDHGVSDAVVGFARREATKVALPATLEEARLTIEAWVLSGLHVVWLGTADPRSWGQRLAILEATSMSPQLIPGVTQSPR